MDPRRFGRRALSAKAPTSPEGTIAFWADVRLFASTFAGGFLLVSFLIF
jgi:hypothetical protein